MASTNPNPVMYRETWHSTGSTNLIEEWNYDPDEENDWSTVEKIHLEEVTPAELAGLMDDAMDNANYHDSAGVHCYLAEVLEKQVGYSAALRILCQIYTEHGWLAEID